MIEAAVSAGIALLAGTAALTNRLHTRISRLDDRLDKVELRVATEYVSKSEHKETLEDLKSHMIRIEHKLDTFIQNFPKS